MPSATRRTVITALLLGASLALPGCGSSDNLQACPAKGLGVESKSGKGCTSAAPRLNTCSKTGKECASGEVCSADNVCIGQPCSATTSCASARTCSSGQCLSDDWLDCVAQIADYKKFACSEPQACVDQPKWIISGPPFTVDPTAPAREASLILTNCSTGNRKLTISKIIIAGDTRCSFSDPELTDKVASPSGEITIRTKYLPKTIGEDHAAILIYTDAQNFKPLVVPICGRAVPQFEPGKDSGTPPKSPDGGAPVTTAFACKDVGVTVNTTCHKQ